MEDPEHTTLVPGTLHIFHDRRRGVYCLNVRDLLINNGLPLKFNRTSISGRCEDMGRCVVVHRVPCASRKTLLFGVDHYRNCNRLGVGWQWWWWAIGRVYMKRRRRKKLQKQAKLLRRISATKRRRPAAQLLYGSRVSTFSVHIYMCVYARFILYAMI